MWEQTNPKGDIVIPLSFPFYTSYLLLLVVPCAKIGLVPATNQERKWQPAPVSLPGKSHGQRNLVGCSPSCCKESGKTERLTLTYLIRGCKWAYAQGQSGKGTCLGTCKIDLYIFI